MFCRNIFKLCLKLYFQGQLEGEGVEDGYVFINLPDYVVKFTTDRPMRTIFIVIDLEMLFTFVCLSTSIFNGLLGLD